MIKEGLVFLNTKNNPCLILKVDDKYCWVFARTTKGFNCNHYGKWYIEQCLRCGNYHILNNYKTWQEAVNGEEFSPFTSTVKEVVTMELRDQIEILKQKVINFKRLLGECSSFLYDKDLNDDLQYEIDEAIK